ncbi:MAG: hypothetical protein U9R34_00145 [Nanoarchaeota archaeon]|nr:hypothetical protein [Nanoarchaeota archaeon]
MIDKNDFISLEEAIKTKDEKLIKKTVIVYLEMFLSDSLSKSEIAYDFDAFVTVPMNQEWDEEFHFQDKKLKFIVDKIQNLESKSNVEAKKCVKDLLKLLKENTNSKNEFEKIAIKDLLEFYNTYILFFYIY